MNPEILIKEINPYESEICHEYNKRGERIKTIYADGTTEQMEYDGNGNVVKHTDHEGNATHYEYDKRDRVCASINSLGGRKKITYSPTGNRRKKEDRDGYY